MTLKAFQKLEIQTANGHWNLVTPDLFRAWGGNRRKDDKPYQGPIFILGTEKIAVPYTVTIEKHWDTRDIRGVRNITKKEGRNGRIYVSQRRLLRLVLVNGEHDSTHSAKREATARKHALEKAAAPPKNLPGTVVK